MKGSLLKDKLDKAVFYLGEIERSFSENGTSKSIEAFTALKGLIAEADKDREKLESANKGLFEEVDRLQAERHKYYDLFASAPDGYILTDKHCVILEANRKAETLLKIPPRCLEGRSFFEFISEGELEFFKSRLERLNAIESMEEWEVTLNPSVGEGLSTSITVVNIYGLSGEENGFRWLIRDISERKRRDEQMIQNFELLQGVMDNSATFIFIKDLESRYLLVNRRMEEIAPASHFLGKSPYDLYPIEFADRLIQNDKIVIESGKAMEFEEMVPFGNKVGTFLTIKFPIKNCSGSAVALCCISSDITERKRAENSIKDKLELLQGMMDYSGSYIYTKDREGKYVFVNRPLEKLIGRDPIGKTDFDMFSEKTAIEFSRQDMMAFEKGGAIEFESSVAIEGNTYYFRSIKFPIYDAPGFPNLVCGILTDITGKMRAEESEKESRNLLKAVIENSGASIYIKDCEGKYIHSNKACEEMVGASMAGKTDYELFSKEYADSIREKDRLAQESGRPVEYETTLTVRGEEHTFVINKFPIFDSSGAPKGICGIATEITGRKKAEIAIRESRELLQGVMDNSTAAIFIRDLEGRFMMVNRMHERVTGLSAEHIIGRTPYEIFPKGVAEKFISTDREILSSGKPSSLEFDLPLDDGVHTFISNKFPILGANGKPKAVCGISTDITQRKKAEEALRKSEASLANAQRIAKLGNWEWDIVNDDEYWSPEVFMIFGMEPVKTFKRELFLKAVHPEDREILDKNVNDARYEGKPYSVVFRIILPDGAVKTIHSQAEIEYGPSGEPLRMSGVIQDITERKDMENKAKAQLAFLQTLIETVPSPIFYKDIEGRYLGCNKAFEKALGVKIEDVEGKSVYDLAPKDFADKYFEMDSRLFNNPGVQIYDTLVKYADGETHNIIFHKATYNGPDGKLAGLVGIMTDITFQKRAEDAVKESEERFRKLFEQNQDAQILFRSGACEIMDANPAAIALYGYTLEELKESGTCMFMGSGDRMCCEDLMKSGFNIEKVTTYKKNGEKVVASIKGQVIKLKESEVVYCTIRDLTNLITMEEEARYIQAKLIHANKMTSIGTLASGVAHEVNNPNNFILFNSTLLLDVWSDAVNILEGYFREHGEFSMGGLPFSEMRAVIPELLSGIADGSRRIKGIVDTLKDFSKLDKTGLEGEFDVNRAVLSSASILNTQINKYTEKFTLSCGQHLSLVKGSAQKIEQVIINLIINALHALPDRKKGVTVETSMEGGFVIIKVLDEGLGMSKEVLERITEPFFTTKTDSGGTGLGLSISYTIIKEHNGSIEFDSAPGKGTAVTIKLPAHFEKTEVH